MASCSLHRRPENGSWYCLARIKGKQKRIHIGKCSEELAHAIWEKHRDNTMKINMGMELDVHVTWADFFDRYFNWVRNRQAKNTLMSKKTSFHHIKRFMQEKNVDFERDNLMAFQAAWVEEFAEKRIQEGAATKSINVELLVISNMFKRAAQWKYICPNITVETFKDRRKKPRFFSPQEISSIMANADEWIKQFIMLALHTGMRISEIVNLEWADIDFHNSSICVANTETFTTKSGSERFIPMTETIKDYLFWLQKKWPSQLKSDEVFDRQPHQMKYVTCKANGEPFNRHIQKFRKLLDRVGIEQASLHTMRHTFASNCVMSGVDIYTVKEFLGHSDISTTERYAHLTNSYKIKQIQKVKDISRLLPFEQENERETAMISARRP